MKSIFEQNGGTYTQVGDYLIPDISLPDAPAYPIGKYGRMREAYLKEHRPGLYTRLMCNLNDGRTMLHSPGLGLHSSGVWIFCSVSWEIHYNHVFQQTGGNLKLFYIN